MRKCTTWLAIILMLLAPMGCASEKAWTDYHASIDKQTDALLVFAREQGVREASARSSMMSTYSASMSRAALTPEATDDVLLAFAWGVEIATPRDTSLPKLPTITPPDKSSDLVRAWTPIVGMAVPFMYLAANGWSGSSDGSSYTATDNAKINISSENAGSFNKAGDDQSISTTYAPVEEDCLGCTTDPDSGLEVNPVDVDPENPIEDPEEAPESCGTSGGWYNNGTWWLSEGSTCSCASREAGRC